MKGDDALASILREMMQGKEFKDTQPESEPEPELEPATKKKKKKPFQLVDWLSTQKAIDSIAKMDVMAQVDRAFNNLVVINNFLPIKVAKALLNNLNSTAMDWETSTSEIDASMEGTDGHKTGAGTTQHAFAATGGVIVDPTSIPKEEGGCLMERFLHILGAGLLGTTQSSSSERNVLGTFQYARYISGHFIEAHDDCAYKVCCIYTIKLL